MGRACHPLVLSMTSSGSPVRPERECHTATCILRRVSGTCALLVSSQSRLQPSQQLYEYSPQNVTTVAQPQMYMVADRYQAPPQEMTYSVQQVPQQMSVPNTAWDDFNKRRNAAIARQVPPVT